MATRGFEQVTAADAARMGRQGARMAPAKRSKYGAVKTTVDGITFDSAKEAKRYGELKLLERAGKIDSLVLQPVFEIFVDVSQDGDRRVRICDYRADFQYYRKRERIVEDVKGMKTPVYRIKKKLVEALYDLTITEI